MTTANVVADKNLSLKTVITLDRASARSFDENGYMRIKDCPISKETVNPYMGHEIPNWEGLGLDPDKIYNVYRPASALREAAESFIGLPLLLDHHPESAEDPATEHRVGSITGNVHFSSPYFRGDLIVTDIKGIEAIESGEAAEISAAYMFDPVLQSGEFNGVRYQIVMTNMRGNHAAFVNKGRAGPDVRVLDSAIIPDPTKGDTPVSRKSENSRQRLRRRMVKDENLIEAVKELAVEAGAPIEQVETVIAGEINEAEVEAAADPDPTHDEASLDEFITRHNLSDEAAEELRGIVGAMMAREEEPVSTDEQTEDPENKDKPVASDKLPARLTVADADRIRREARDSTLSYVRNLHEAAALVEPIVGRINPVAFDSAEKIYAHALDAAGLDRKGEPASAYRGMVKAHLASQRGHALDSAFERSGVTQGGLDDGPDSPLRFLNKIR